MPTNRLACLRYYASSSISNGKRKAKLEEALAYCAKIVRERDYENYLAALLFPKRAQPRVFSVLALNAEVAMLRHKIKRGSGLAGINQLTFWKDAIELFGRSSRERENGAALLPRQPVMTALSAFGDSSDVFLLLNLISARQQTLGDRPFPSVSALEQNARLLYASLILLQMRALHDVQRRDAVDQFIDEALQRAVDAMACAVGILTLVRATILLLRDGILLLPSDLTTKHSVSAEMVYREPNSLKAVVRDLCDISECHLQTARSPASLASIRSELRPALLTCGLRSDYTLQVLHGNNYNLLDERLHQNHPLSGWKLWWRNKRHRY